MPSDSSLYRPASWPSTRSAAAWPPLRWRSSGARDTGLDPPESPAPYAPSRSGAPPSRSRNRTPRSSFFQDQSARIFIAGSPVRTLLGDAASDRLLGLFFAPGRGSVSIREIDAVSVNSLFIRNLDNLYWSLAFTENRQLFAIDVSNEEIGLFDLVDFSIASSSALSGEIGTPSIASDGQGGLFLLSTGALGEPGILNALDPLTGKLTHLGSTQTDSRFLSLAYIPEPGSLVLLLIAAGVCFGRRVSPFRPKQ